MMQADEEDGCPPQHGIKEETEGLISCAQSSLDRDTRPMTECSLAVVGTAEATTTKRSDSILSTDDSDHGLDQSDATRLHQRTRSSSVRYIEEASMEASLVKIPASDEGQFATHLKRSQSEALVISPSGRMGRRRSSVSESDMILVSGSDLEGYSEDQESLERSDFYSMDKSDRGFFQSAPEPNIIQQSSGSLTVPQTEEAKERPTDANHGEKSIADILISQNILSMDDARNMESVEKLDAHILQLLVKGLVVQSLAEVDFHAFLRMELLKKYSKSDSIPLPDQPVIAMTSNCPASRMFGVRCKGVPVLLQLPMYFSVSFLRVLVRLLSQESDPEFNNFCFLTKVWEKSWGGVSVDDDPPIDPDHPTRRPNLLYNVARFQCRGRWNRDCQEEMPVIEDVLDLWERAAMSKSHSDLVAPLARLLGLLSVAGVTPRLLRRMLVLVQSSLFPPKARLCMVKAIRTAAVGSSQTSLLPKIQPRSFFCFFGQGLVRTIHGLPSWPFRNDFGMALWFRSEGSEPRGRAAPVLFGVHTDDGAGVEVSLVPLETKSSEAYTIAVSVFDSGRPKVPAHRLKVKSCVLLRRVWYHIAVRHTRSRLKGVFSLSTRQLVSIMIDGKVMLSESLHFPKVSDGDARGDKLLPATLRRSVSSSNVNIILKFGDNFCGEMGKLYLFNDHVSDASLRALYELSGGQVSMLTRSKSVDNSWDARRGDIVRKARVLDANLKDDDADDIVLSQRRLTTKRRGLDEKYVSILDLGPEEDVDESCTPVDLQKAAFGSKLFLTWDPKRAVAAMALELHVGAHLNTDGAFSWRGNGAKEVISSIGGVQCLLPICYSLLSGDIDRSLPTSMPREVCTAESIVSIIPELILLVASFMEESNDNAREMLRCGGIDVLEQLLFTSKKQCSERKDEMSLFWSLGSTPGLATFLARTLLKLRASCSHYAGLETKIFSRLVFNLQLWTEGTSNFNSHSIPSVMVPMLASMTRLNPEKIRDCVGVKHMVNALNAVVPFVARETPVDKYAADPIGLILGMIFDTMSTGSSPEDVTTFVQFIAYLLSSTRAEASVVSSSLKDVQRKLLLECCYILHFLLLIRPPVPGLLEGIGTCCGSLQGGVGFLLCGLVNSYDDEIRAIGLRSVACFVDITSRGPDAALSLSSGGQTSDQETIGGPESQSMLRTPKGLGIIAKGLATMGPGMRSIVVSPSKSTPRVIYKLMWHLLKAQRYRITDKSHAALMSLVADDNGIVTASLASGEFLRNHLLVKCRGPSTGYVLSTQWARAIFEQTDSVVGKSLKNPLAIGTILRLLRFMPVESQNDWLANLLVLGKSSRKSVSLLASLSDWQPSLFLLISEILEIIHSGRLSQSTGNALPRPSKPIQDADSGRSVHSSENEIIHNAQLLDRCLGLYSMLIGSLVREGGDKALHAVETAASLQRVCVNGHDVLLLILSNLCCDIFDHGTLVDLRPISAKEWETVDLEQDSILLRQSAKLVTDAILSNGVKGLDMTKAVQSWRSLRHLAEVVVAIVTRSGFGVVDLFDYVNHQAAAVDETSGGLHGIRLSESRLSGVKANAYIRFVESWRTARRSDRFRDELKKYVDRRLCVTLATQVLSLLDPFIFPDTSDESSAASQFHGLALVRNSESRLGTSQGPLVLSAIRLSYVLLAILEPCSVQFLQCASRLRCLLSWTLELIREAGQQGQPVSFSKPVFRYDIQIVATILHCHRALGRCASLLSEIESSSYEKYFPSREVQRKYYRRLLRVGLELREVVSMIFRGRNDAIRWTLAGEAFEALRMSLEISDSIGKPSSKESVIRKFLSSTWISAFQDTETRADLAVPEQVAMDTIPLDAMEGVDVPCQGFAVIEKLAQESSGIQLEFEKSINTCFEEYLEAQRKWTETDAVRELEFEGDTILSRLVERQKVDAADAGKLNASRRGFADSRWRGIQRKTLDPWSTPSHWKLARYTDRLGRRTLMVPNEHFDTHKNASYDLVLERENETQQQSRKKRLLEKEELSEVMRRNAEAFSKNDISPDSDGQDEDSTLQVSDADSTTDLDSCTDGDSRSDTQEPDNYGVAEGQSLVKDSGLNQSEHEDEWDKIESEDLKDIGSEGDIDGWARAFIWSDNEAVVARFEPVMVVALQSFVEGRLLLTTHGLYFHQTSNEVNVMTREPLEGPEPSAKDRRWRLSRLTEIHGRRYMLRQQALELFFSDSHELFLNFPAGMKERDRFHAKLRNNAKVPLLWSPKSLNPRTVFRKSKLTELWRKRKITNFEYLMALNRMAGRSFNDITQYPVFPWVLADYTSEKIDLTDTRIYRDLSKPIGALNPDRLAQLLERYKDLDLFGFQESEKFLYGSHYSSPGIILHYMIRQEPFTTMAIDLQSGRFDCPDRLFFDLAASWNSCMTSTSDMKELIPEFFNLPEMFLNTNDFPLGKTQSGRAVDNVDLPPWAKGSAYEFVRIHRQALESEHVSQNIHHWIDLVFGYKQRGPDAEAAHNIFHHLSYEGSVDLDMIADDIDRRAAESHIQNFGQTPSLLSNEPHPCRYPADQCWKPLIYDMTMPTTLRCHCPSKQFGNKRIEFARGPILKILVLSDTVIAMYGDMSIGTYRCLQDAKNGRIRMDKIRQMSRPELSRSKAAMKRGSAIPAARSTDWIGPQCFSITVGGHAKEELRRKAAMPTGRLIGTNDITLATAEASSMILSCGYWDDTVKAHGSDGARVLASETGGHRGQIFCVAMGQDGGLMVTGGQDCTVRVWVVAHRDMAVALSDGYVQTALGSSIDGDSLLNCCHVLWGHETPVFSVDLDSDLDAVVSGDAAGRVCIHTIRRGEFIRSLHPPRLSAKSTSDMGVVKIAMGPVGNFAVHLADNGLHSYTMNGKKLQTVDTGERINDMLVCSSGEVLVTGGTKGVVLVRSLCDLNILAMLELSKHGCITCVSMTSDDLNPIPQLLYIGSEDGMITVVDQDPLLSPKDAEAIIF